MIHYVYIVTVFFAVRLDFEVWTKHFQEWCESILGSSPSSGISWSRWQYQPSSHLLPYTVQKQSKLDCHILSHCPLFFHDLSSQFFPFRIFHFSHHCASFQGYFRVVGSHWGHGLVVICAYFCIDCIWLHMIALYICDLPGCGCGCSWLQLTRYGWLWWLWGVRDKAFVKRSDTKVVFW